jgi:uncharacterized protein YndB with AHSA1/START domain
VIDVSQQLNAVRRQVGSRTLEAGQASTVTMSQVYDADLEDAWDACTNPERLRRWFLPVSGDLREGGSYQVEGNASGTVESCEPPHRFSATWEYGDAISWIEVQLVSEGVGRTRVQLEHIALIDDHWEEYGPGAAGLGWEVAFVGLRLHLSSGEAASPAEVEAWMASDDGRRFFRLSSEAWARAHIAAGAGEAAALAAAGRAEAFYTEA